MVQNSDSRFEGGLLGLIGVGIVSFLITLFTLGICYPWAVCYRERWYAKNTVIEGRRLMFKGTAVGLFGQYIKWVLLCIITVGIYSFWLNIKMKQWVVKHTVFGQ